MKNKIQSKDIFFTIWLLIMSYFTLATYVEQRQGIENLDGSITNQDTLKSNQKLMLENQDSIKIITDENLDKNLHAIKEFVNKKK